MSRALRAVLSDLPSGGSFAESESEETREFLRWLDSFLTEVLGEVHPEWIDPQGWGEAMDGIVPIVARKTAEAEAELLGACYLLTNQARSTAMIPVHVQLQVAPIEDEIIWLECRFGERGKEGIVRLPYDHVNLLPKRFYLLDGNYDRIDWFYAVTFGERRQS